MTRVPEDYLFDLENNVCLLIKEGGEYRFIHRSFQTYFSAVFAMEFISDSKQKLLFSKMISGDRFSDFKEFFKFLYGLEGKRCLDNLFAEFKTFYIENGEDKYFSLLRLIFEDIGLEMAGKGSRHADSYYEISDSDDFVYDIAFRKREKNEKSIRLYELYLVQNEKGWFSWIGAGIFAGATFAFGTFIGMKNPRLLENFSL